MKQKNPNKPKQSISDRAYYKFLERGGEHGHDLEDWLAAERELNAPQKSAKKKTTIKSNRNKSKEKGF